VQQPTLAIHYAFDPRLQCLTYLSRVLWSLGYPDQALQRSHEACRLAWELTRPQGLAQVLYYATTIHQLRREAHAVSEQAEALITLATAQGFSVYEATGRFLRGWALVAQGQGETGVVQMRQGLTDVLATGVEIARPHYLVLLAETCEKLGLVDEGFSMVAEALRAMDESGRGDFKAEAYRLKGALLLRQTMPDVPQAATRFNQALDVARHQQAKSLELRAATSLARLWQSQGKRQEASALLAPVYGWFTEGFDTADLQEAKALLEELV
jgi:predicted ATPase